jgi:L-malate glycosyltransferase
MQVLHQGGGAGSVTSTLHLSLGLARAGFQVRFVCPPDSEVEASARAGGLEVHPIVLQPRSHRLNAARLSTLLSRSPVDLINSQSSRDRAALTWLAVTRKLRVPVVLTRRQMPRTFPLENWLASHLAAQVVAVSPAVGKALIRRGTPRRKLVVIPNGLVTERVDRTPSADSVESWRRRIGWEPLRPTIGIVARAKDQAVVLQALERVTVPLRLVLAGIEPATSLGRRAATVPTRHQVVCVPFTVDIRGLYELLELVLLPSRIEGLSQTLLEAMALGKPVIASRAGGNPDLITDGVDGRLVEPLNPAAWAQAIDQLLGDRNMAATFATAARHKARTTYALEHTVDRTASLYRALIERSPSLK